MTEQGRRHQFSASLAISHAAHSLEGWQLELYFCQIGAQRGGGIKVISSAHTPGMLYKYFIHAGIYDAWGLHFCVNLSLRQEP